jgi:hypothetical protein
MKGIGCLILGLGLTTLGLASEPCLVSVRKYTGIFLWVKIGALPAASGKSLAKAKTILIDVTFKQKAILKKDKGGHEWFTFILVDQGGDWKWNQTSGSAGVPFSAGVIKPGKYTLTLPVTGIPRSVLSGTKHYITLGVNTSGLSAQTGFDVNRITGK